VEENVTCTAMSMGEFGSMTVRRPGVAAQTARMAVNPAQTARMVGDPCDAAQTTTMVGDALRLTELEADLAPSMRRPGLLAWWAGPLTRRPGLVGGARRSVLLAWWAVPGALACSRGRRHPAIWPARVEELRGGELVYLPATSLGCFPAHVGARRRPRGGADSR
jgi:hypothetical protein